MDLTSADWRKSSYSSNGGATCIEVAAVWRKSSHSSNGGNTCVEVAADGSRVIAVRDSTDPGGAALTFGPREWRRFADRVKAGHTRVA